MPSPFLTDVIHISPAINGVRSISAGPGGGLQFNDPSASLQLIQLAGLRNMHGVFLVGKGGSGSPYNSIQSAIDALPPSTSPDNPATILIGPGVYEENLAIYQSGISLVGLGGAVIKNDGNADTIHISENSLGIPETLVIANLHVVNTSPSRSCIRITGGSTYASGDVVVLSAPLVAGDTLTIGGVVLVGVSGPRTPGGDNFSVNPSTPDSIAAEIVGAINDPLNSLFGIVVASRVDSTLRIGAVTSGPAGNLIGLSTTSSALSPTSVTLIGGSNSGSRVGIAQIWIEDCRLEATSTSGYVLRSEFVNYIRLRGGTCSGSSSLASMGVLNTASFRVIGTSQIPNTQFSYDSSLGHPEITTSEYTIANGDVVGGIVANLEDVTSLNVLDVGSVLDVAITGNRTFLAQNTRIGNLVLGGTTNAVLYNTPRMSANVSDGSPTLIESSITGVLEFLDEDLKSFVFDVPQPDSNYTVLVQPLPTAIPVSISVQSPTGFNVLLPSPYTGNIRFTVIRSI
jgi:hypothetical protein